MDKLKEKIIEAYYSCKKSHLGVSPADLGNALRKLMPDFSPKAYGEDKFTSILRKLSDSFCIANDDADPSKIFVQLTSNHNNQIFDTRNLYSAASNSEGQATHKKSGTIIELSNEKNIGHILEDDTQTDLTKKLRRLFF